MDEQQAGVLENEIAALNQDTAGELEQVRVELERLSSEGGDLSGPIGRLANLRTSVQQRSQHIRNLLTNGQPEPTP